MSSIERSQLATSTTGQFTADSEALARVLGDRFSCRAFRPDPVPQALIDRMFEIAQMAPSWCNTQPWKVTVTSGAATEVLRAALLEDADRLAGNNEGSGSDIPFPQAYSGVHLERRREVGWQLYESAGVVKGDREGAARQARENQRLFGAPHAVLIHSPRELGTYGAIDCGVYLGTLLLAAQSLGLAIIPQAALALHSALIKRHFGVPDDLVFVVGASFGYAVEESPVNLFRSRRAPIAESVTLVSG